MPIIFNVPQPIYSLLAMGMYFKRLQGKGEVRFAGLKHFDAIARRQDQLKRNYQSILVLVSSFIWLPT
ncbi:hypothetical protein CMK12_08060 [Candidatus Poribacteria bacterium]|nr:hypothetical protein [Candidatus Poribacteria bacterium]